MISFRYHLVSIIAVFLALALGIVVGTTALNGPITKDLRNQVNSTKAQRDRLAGQVKSLQGQVGDAGQFASTYGSQLVAGTLKGRSVVLLAMPGVPDAMSSGVSHELGAAGATISGRVSLTDDYLDASQGNGIVQLATGSGRPLGVTLPETSDAGRLGAALLAYVLAGKPQASDISSVLGGMSQLHLLDVTGNVKAASTVVVLAHGTQRTDEYPAQSELDLVTALQSGRAHVVVAGDAGSASRYGLVAQVRNAGSNRTAVSTVDNADTAFGQVSTVLAVADSLGGNDGHYGTQNGADALYPAPGS